MEKTTLKEMVEAYQQTVTPAIKEEAFETIVDVVSGVTYEVYGMMLDACVDGGIFDIIFEKYESNEKDSTKPWNIFDFTQPWFILGKLSRVFYFSGDFHKFADIRYDADKDVFVFIDEYKREIVRLDAKYFEDEMKCLQMELDIIIDNIEHVLVNIDGLQRNENMYRCYEELLKYFQEKRNSI